MIINKKNQFVFVHIPKCGGTSVRNTLQSFDSCNGRFHERIGIHEELGQLDYTHIPLFTLREYFPDEFEAVRDYHSFAVMRNPFSRFASSVSQYLKMYKPIHKCSAGEIQAVTKNTINHLSKLPRNKHQLSSQYIHFQKQFDYIELDGERIIDNIYTLNKINELLLDVGRHVRQNLVDPADKRNGASENRSFVFRNDHLRNTIEAARPVTNRLGKMLPEAFKKQIRNLTYVPRDQRTKALFTASHVKEFIKDYYADDIALYSHVSQQECSETP
jgi:hypothetical protein